MNRTLADDLTSRFAAIPTSTICDALIRSGIRKPETAFISGLVPLSPRVIRVAGRARTERMVIVRDPGRSAMVLDRALTFRLVEEASPGDFLFVSAPAGLPYAVFGGSLAMVAKRNGAVGAVIDGATRDTAELEQLRFPTWAAGVTPIPGGYGGYSVAEVDTPVNCRGVEVRPGDVVVADGDGVIVVPADDVAALIDVCEAMNADERASHEALAAGKSMDESYPSRSYYTRKT